MAVASTSWTSLASARLPYEEQQRYNHSGTDTGLDTQDGLTLALGWESRSGRTPMDIADS